MRPMLMHHTVQRECTEYDVNIKEQIAETVEYMITILAGRQRRVGIEEERDKSLCTVKGGQKEYV